MFNVRLAGGHLYGKWQFTWLSLVISLMVGVLFCAVLFPLEISWMRSGSEFSRFLRIFLPTLAPADNYLFSVPPCFPAALFQIIIESSNFVSLHVYDFTFYHDHLLVIFGVFALKTVLI